MTVMMRTLHRVQALSGLIKHILQVRPVDGIDLLSELPGCIVGEVALLYEAPEKTEIAKITYENQRFSHRTTYYGNHEDSDQEDRPFVDIQISCPVTKSCL